LVFVAASNLSNSDFAIRSLLHQFLLQTKNASRFAPAAASGPNSRIASMRKTVPAAQDSSLVTYDFGQLDAAALRLVHTGPTASCDGFPVAIRTGASFPDRSSCSVAPPAGLVRKLKMEGDNCFFVLLPKAHTRT